MPFWKRESLHERLAREGGLGERAPIDTTPRWGEVGIHGQQRPREWDAVATVDAPGLAGDEAEFVVLPDGSLLVDENVDAAQFDVLADALSLEPPYRAKAVRRGESMWAIGASKLTVVELPDDVVGDEILLSVSNGERSLNNDGKYTFGSIPALERHAEAHYKSYVVRAERLDGQLFEVKVNPL